MDEQQPGEKEEVVPVDEVRVRREQLVHLPQAQLGVRDRVLAQDTVVAPERLVSGRPGLSELGEAVPRQAGSPALGAAFDEQRVLQLANAFEQAGGDQP